MGTEGGLNSISDVRPHESFWYWHDDSLLQADGCGDDDADLHWHSDLHEAVSFSRSLYVPGTFHLIDNVSKFSPPPHSNHWDVSFVWARTRL